MKILITGAQGFIGPKLMERLSSRGHAVFGPEIDLHFADSIEQTIRLEHWDTIIHLAGMSSPAQCEKAPSEAYRSNLSGTALLLDAIVAHSPKAHLIFASSAFVYGFTDSALTETSALKPAGVYGRTKRAAEALIEDYARLYGLRSTVLRLFAHTHRSQPPVFFLPSMYAQLRSLAQDPSSGSTVQVGNLNLQRDIGDVGSLVEAFVAVTELPHSAERVEYFNVCSGHAKNLGTLARLLAQALYPKAEFVTAPERVRAGEAPLILGSHQKLTERTGWQPRCRTEADLIREFLT